MIIILILILIIFLLFYNFYLEPFDNKINYIFWTGGYDSTFRICQALILEKKTIQPVYISYKHLDNHPKNKFKRKSHYQELKTMNDIRNMITFKYPQLSKKLLKTKIISKLEMDNDIIKSMDNLWKQGRNHRSFSQYGGLAQVTRNLNKDIELAVENSKHSTMRNMVYKYIGKDNLNRNIIVNPDLDLNIFKHFIFPTINISKKEMFTIAKKNDFEDILNITWTCWFPNNGKQCGRCTMCRQRYIHN